MADEKKVVCFGELSTSLKVMVILCWILIAIYATALASVMFGG